MVYISPQLRVSYIILAQQDSFEDFNDADKIPPNINLAKLTTKNNNCLLTEREL